jgi:hypothetical protein
MGFAQKLTRKMRTPLLVLAIIAIASLSTHAVRASLIYLTIMLIAAKISGWISCDGWMIGISSITPITSITIE